MPALAILAGPFSWTKVASCIGYLGFYANFPEPPQRLVQLDAWNACTANTSPGPASWQCFPESSPGSADGAADATACDPIINGFFECLFGG